MADPPVTRAAMRALQASRVELLKTLLPLPEYDVVYVRVPKAACSTLKLWLHRIHVGDPEAQLTRIHRDHQVPRADEVGWKKVCAMLSGDAFRFTFVRHPETRIESAYRDKVLRMPKFRTQLQGAAGLPLDPDRPLSFEEFVRALENTEPLALDPHFRPQYLNAMMEIIDFDFVGHLESFDADVVKVAESAGLPHLPAQAENVGERSAHGSAFDGRADLRRRVQELYAQDYERLGY